MVFGSFDSGVEMEEGLGCGGALSAFRTAFSVLAFLPADRCTTARVLLFKVVPGVRSLCCATHRPVTQCSEQPWFI